jgi:hypothetical protein
LARFSSFDTYRRERVSNFAYDGVDGLGNFEIELVIYFKYKNTHILALHNPCFHVYHGPKVFLVQEEFMRDIQSKRGQINNLTRAESKNYL